MTSRIIGAVVCAYILESFATLFRLVAPAATASALDCALSGKFELTWMARAIGSLGITVEDRSAAIKGLCLVALASCVVSVLVSFLGSWLMSHIVRLFQTSLRARLLRHLLGMPLGELNRLTSGSVVSLVRVDASAVGELVRKLVFSPLCSATQLAGGIVLVSLVDWRLLFIALVLLPLVWITHWSWNNRVQPLQKDLFKERGECDSRVASAMLGIRVIRLYAQEGNELDRWAIHDDKSRCLDAKSWLETQGVRSLWDLVLPSMGIALLWWAGSELIDGRLTPGDILLFSLCVSILVSPMHAIAESLAGGLSSLTSLHRVCDVLDCPLEDDALPAGIRPAKSSSFSRGLISLRDVTFHYPGGNGEALKRVTLELRPKEMVAFVGANGSGKTTLANLIAGFYRPCSGCILIDGDPLAEMSLRDYRRNLALVDQDIFLFKGTIAANIAFSRPNVTLAEIETAARTSGAHDFIAPMPEGYETLLGEAGARLSGGQKQRIAIARAILAKPRILILDEFSSQLDPSTERDVLHRMTATPPTGPMLVITHRREVAAMADRVVMLAAGRIVEDGTHTDLLANSIEYRKFWLEAGEEKTSKQMTSNKVSQ